MELEEILANTPVEYMELLMDMYAYCMTLRDLEPREKGIYSFFFFNTIVPVLDGYLQGEPYTEVRELCNKDKYDELPLDVLDDFIELYNIIDRACLYIFEKVKMNPLRYPWISHKYVGKLQAAFFEGIGLDGEPIYESNHLRKICVIDRLN